MSDRLTDEAVERVVKVTHPDTVPGKLSREVQEWRALYEEPMFLLPPAQHLPTPVYFRGRDFTDAGDLLAALWEARP